MYDITGILKYICFKVTFCPILTNDENQFLAFTSPPSKRPLRNATSPLELDAPLKQKTQIEKMSQMKKQIIIKRSSPVNKN